MKRHTQIWTGKNGSCFATCVACILDLELEQVPHFTACVRWPEVLDLWCWQHGLTWHHSLGDSGRCHLAHRTSDYDFRDVRPECWLPAPTTGLVIAGGESPRAGPDGMPLGHAVVWDLDKDELAWDPNPERTGLAGRPVRWYWFVKKAELDRCRDEECGHVKTLHAERSTTVGAAELACSVDACGCSEFIGSDRSQCERCGSWDGGLCVCWAR